MEYSITIDEFSGPLDLLLHLIKQAKLDIYNINIEIITNQYLDYIKQMEDLNLTVASSYLVMAAELLELKSKSLLPKHALDEEDTYEDEKNNLIDRLVTYEKYKEMTPLFRDLEQTRGDFFTKYPSSLSEYSEDSAIGESSVTIDDLMNAFSNLMERKIEEKPIHTKITSKEIDIEEISRKISSILKDKKEISFSKLFDNFDRPYVVATFLAMLEMVKKKEIIIFQNDNFSSIMLKEGSDK